LLFRRKLERLRHCCFALSPPEICTTSPLLFGQRSRVLYSVSRVRLHSQLFSSLRSYIASYSSR
jgi:hypothetical protein